MQASYEATSAIARGRYERWMRFDLMEPWKHELQQVKDPKEMEDRFYRHLEYGTGGLRGEIGAGINRINTYTIRRAAMGLALYLRRKGLAYMKKGVVISYDNRMFSAHFAEETALVLARGGIPVYLFDRMRPTPMLSFAVRELKAAAGVAVTASHNPAEYNGLKIFGENGGQITPKIAAALMRSMERVNDELLVEAMRLQQAMRKGYLTYIGDDLEESYYRRLEELVLDAESARRMGEVLSVVYTPLHGCGGIPVREALGRAGFTHVYKVEAQEKPDPYFPTVDAPNPEEEEAMSLATDTAKQVHADLILGTDPDVDRTGVAVRTHNGSYLQLSGNQLGALLLDYVLMQRHRHNSLPENGAWIKSIVTSDLGRRIADEYGVETVETLIGFKYIAEKIADFEQQGTRTFLFGCEESHGYLAGDFVRDRDGIQTCQLVCEMAAYHKSLGRTLDEVLEQLYARHGYHRESQFSYVWKGREGASRMKRIMRQLRKQPVPDWRHNGAAKVYDYLSSTVTYADGRSEALHMLRADVMKYVLQDGSWVAVRPSGTEPKLKVYFGVSGKTRESCERKHQSLCQQVELWLEQVFEEAKHQRKRRKNQR
ncbi:phospho-sugar mutase [Xylanibacillus composti]|uniref:phosphoglucomutase (alpha-D-glucose-1,6-bisphosphate-dependent) n=1 Tax=Xylanibacillus composti TaxID=1572762 RepID=A0A8J4H147_9BACL|nr:phospho-sugar mutase [Xylanibacillus composti]MDT9725788.1 phospho-sugar mutase [Xylanibacillus composti]GIQ67496.1 phosphoglucomutase [Xylanibacillus composti]